MVGQSACKQGLNVELMNSEASNKPFKGLCCRFDGKVWWQSFQKCFDALVEFCVLLGSLSIQKRESDQCIWSWGNMQAYLKYTIDGLHCFREERLFKGSKALIDRNQFRNTIMTESKNGFEIVISCFARGKEKRSLVFARGLCRIPQVSGANVLQLLLQRSHCGYRLPWNSMRILFSRNSWRSFSRAACADIWLIRGATCLATYWKSRHVTDWRRVLDHLLYSYATYMISYYTKKQLHADAHFQDYLYNKWNPVKYCCNSFIDNKLVTKVYIGARCLEMVSCPTVAKVLWAYHKLVALTSVLFHTVCNMQHAKRFCRSIG